MFLLVRHGQSTWNAEHRWAGQADPPLSDLGRRQAGELARALVDDRISRVVTSDLGRARETAEIVADRLGIGHVDVVTDLRERSCGDWEGRTSDEIEAAYPGMLARWRAGEDVGTVPGEERDEFERRIDRALAALSAAHHTNTLIVAHAGLLRVLSKWSGIALGDIANTSGLRFELIDAKPTDVRIFDPGAGAGGTTVTVVSNEQDLPADGGDTIAPAVEERVDLDIVERDLAAVETALSRLSDGTYWTDEVTGDPIPDEILVADPTARRA